MRKLFCILIVVMMLFSVVSCNKKETEFSNNVKIQFDEKMTVEDIEKKLKKHGYVNARDEWSGEDGKIYVETEPSIGESHSVGYAGDCWIPDIDIFGLESGTYDILVYRVFFEEDEYDGILDRIIFREIPTKITVEKEYSSYVGYPEHHVVLDWNIEIEGVFSFSITMSSYYDNFYLVKKDGEKIPLEFK